MTNAHRPSTNCSTRSPVQPSTRPARKHVGRSTGTALDTNAPTGYYALYRGFGFEPHEGGDHTIYRHPKYPHLWATVARHRHLAAGYAQTAVKRIRELQALQAQEEENAEE